MGYTVGLLIKKPENVDIIYQYLKNKFPDTFVEKKDSNLKYFKPNLEISYGPASFHDPIEPFSEKPRKAFDLLIFYISQHYGIDFICPETGEQSKFYTYDEQPQMCDSLTYQDNFFIFNEDGTFKIMTDEQVDYYLENGHEHEIKYGWFGTESIYSPYTGQANHDNYNRYLIEDFMAIEKELLI